METIVDQGKVLGTLLIEILKAFDCLPHGLFLAKLQAYGCMFLSCHVYVSEWVHTL